ERPSDACFVALALSGGLCVSLKIDFELIALELGPDLGDLRSTSAARSASGFEITISSESGTTSSAIAGPDARDAADAADAADAFGATDARVARTEDTGAALRPEPPRDA